MFLKRRCIGSKQVESMEESAAECCYMSLLDLPELALEGILARLPAVSLAHMACVCQELRKRCRSNHLWEHLFQQKWARIAGPSAFREWQRHLSSQAEIGGATTVVDRSSSSSMRGLWGWPLSCLWPFSWLNLQGEEPATNPPLNSLMAWYWALESGTFWFPAQVYNREVGGSVFYFVFASHPLEDPGRSCSGRDVAYPLDITVGETQFSSISLETVSCCCSARTVPPSLPLQGMVIKLQKTILRFLWHAFHFFSAHQFLFRFGMIATLLAHGGSDDDLL